MTGTGGKTGPPAGFFDEILTLAGKVLIAVMFPWLSLNRDAPLSTRLWRWRYVYGLFGVLTLFVSWDGLLTGVYSPLALAVAPHVLGLAVLFWIETVGPIAGVGIPFLEVADRWVLWGLVLGSGAGVVLQVLRYKSPIFGLSSITYHQSEDELIAPMASVKTGSEGASALPRLDPDVSTLAIGETGSGKTSALELLAYQFPYEAETAVIAHDFGDDFQTFYEDLGFEVLRVAVEDADGIWNLFADVEKERDFRELAGAVFGEPQGSDPFHRPAKQVFEAALRYVHRGPPAAENHDTPTHEDLVEFLRLDREVMQERLQQYSDLAPSAAHLVSETGKSAVNVYQTIHENASQVFVGDFATAGAFSIREYVENPGGRVLVVDSAATEMESVGPMFRLLLDWAIRFAMESDNPVNFILDEVDQLPPLSQLHVLTARGRSAQARALLGIQTVGQLEAQYGKRSDGILGNCPQGVYFSGGEPKTTEYIQSEVGHQRQRVRSTTVRRNSRAGTSGSAASRSRTVSENDRYPVVSGTLKAFGTGDCIVKSREDWWLGRIEQLSAIRHRLVADPSPPDHSPTPALSSPDGQDNACTGGDDTRFVEDPGETPSSTSDIDEPLPLPAPDEVGGELERFVDDGPTTQPPTDSIGGPSSTEQEEVREREEERASFAVESAVYPADMQDHPQWLTWKETDDGRKIPRAPWVSEWPDKYVSAQDPDCWTTFGTAHRAAGKHSGHKMAFTIRNRSEFPTEQYVLVDYDSVRDPETGAIHSSVQTHIDCAESYTDISTSGSGVHILCQGELPEGVKSVDASLPTDSGFPNAEIEVYDSARFIAMTGEHLAETPAQTRECQDFIDELVDEFATVTDQAPDQIVHEPIKDRESIESLTSTDDIQDVLDAIQHVRPSDIRLRSTVTEERADGSKSLDPSWERSESGTRLAQLHDGWVYRKGMHGLDAIQVVALEERIINHPGDYPKGDDFWNAVKSLRDRGAHIPIYEPREGKVTE
ncbi:type IV secretion system DNA-binding domain-containing protein [Haloarchaeobius amylolyticus]|uniref:type IV secretion system DNA-binding domain-containing protein n=1 Tax=Haloarchaeobius amylolyticus TaxID=1198296 RepID=UPI00226FAD4C|nr:type IV secretion system DNA-binding domain-containing protein [Haloarchaeobius amylolyticus]